MGSRGGGALHLWASVSSPTRGHQHDTHTEAAGRRARPAPPGARLHDTGQGCVSALSREHPPFCRVTGNRRRGPWTHWPRAAQSQSHPPSGRLSLDTSASAPYGIHVHLSPLPFVLHPRASAVVNGPESHLQQSHQRPVPPWAAGKGPHSPGKAGGTERWGSRLNTPLTWASGVAKLPETVAGGPRDS